MLISSTSIVLMFLLHLGAERGSSQSYPDPYYESDTCDIQPSFVSPYIKAYYENPTAVRDCHAKVNSSGSATTTARELHVISLKFTNSVKTTRNSQPTPQRRTSVNLRIRPYSDQGVFEGELVFVLNSPQPVTWRIRTERIGNSVQSQFWVSNGSLIKLNPKTNYKLDQFVAEMDIKTLKNWVSTELGLISSNKEIQPNKVITKKVGPAGRTTEPPCSPVVTPVESGGCVAEWNKGVNNKDVHILELKSNLSSVSNLRSTPLIVNILIHPSSKTSMKVHMVLVLKSYQFTQWKIKTKGLRGMLDIITDRAVDTNSIDMQSVRVVNERLISLSGSSLALWTSEKYGPPLSYIESQAANSFEIIVDGSDHVTKPTNGPDQAIQQVFDLLNKSLEKSKHVTCQANGFHVSIPKNAFQPFHLGKNQISLLDQSCVARENVTHFYWDQMGNSCGTTHVKNTYTNAIVIKITKAFPSRLGDFSGASRLDDTLSDDEVTDSEEPFLIQVPIRCSYINYTHLINISNLHYSLKLYMDEDFRHQIISFPSKLKERRRLFVEASVTADSMLRVVIQNCTAYPYGSGTQLGHQLILNGCPNDRTVKWKDVQIGSDEDDQTDQNDRFEFVFQKFWKSDPTMVIRCDLMVCSQSPFSIPGISQCQAREKHCLQSNIIGTNRRPFPANSKSIGPLQMILENPPTQVTETVSTTLPPPSPPSPRPLIHSTSTGCENAIRVEGLNIPTVVCIAFAAFIIGISLIGALWYIHSHTVPQKKHRRGPRLVETSGESTPGSLSAVTIRHNQPLACCSSETAPLQ